MTLCPLCPCSEGESTLMLSAKSMVGLLPALRLRVIRFRRNDTDLSCYVFHHAAPTKIGH